MPPKMTPPTVVSTISTITSPCFDRHQLIDSMPQGSLFCRLSRGLSPPQQSSALDSSLSTIRANDSYSYTSKSTSHHSPEVLEQEATQTRRSELPSEFNKDFRRILNRRGTSNGIDIHKKAKIPNTGRTFSDMSNTDIMNESILSTDATKRDEWREAVDPESNRVYYYNRFTRKSSWKLPKGASLVSKQKNRINAHRQQYLSTSTNTIEITSSSERDVLRRRIATAIDSINTTMEPRNDSVSLSNDGDTVFCLYCGLQCNSVSAFGFHLSRCHGFEKVGLSTQLELERVVFDAWSTPSNSYKTPMPPNESGTSRDLSNDMYLDSTQDKGVDATDSSSPTNYTVVKDTPEDTKTTPQNRHKQKRVVDFSVVDAKQCPFCDIVCNEGNEFSCHLLKCQERRRLRSQRRAKKKESPFLTNPRMRKSVTPGRKLPWE